MLKLLGFTGCILCLIMVLSYYRMENERLSAENAVLLERVVASERALKELQEAHRVTMEALTARDKALDQMQRERETARENFMQVVKNDETSRDWGSVAVPDRVREILVAPGTGRTETGVPGASVRSR